MTQCIILTGGTYTPDEFPKIQRSLGPYRISNSLKNKGYSSFVLDYIMHLSVDEIQKVLEPHLDDNTLWVGFSSTFFWSNNHYSTKKERMYYTDTKIIDSIISFIKSKSNAKIIYGGAKAPYFMADENIDYYVLGYADNSVLELTEHIEKNKPIKIKEMSPTNIMSKVIDSSEYEEPKMNNIKTSWKGQSILHGEGLPLELARGCIFKCKFCSYPLLGKKKGTYLRNPNEIRQELIENWELFGTENYYITDDTFNDDNDKIEALHKVFTSLPFKIKFSAYIRMDLINKYPHQADLLSEMGLIGTYFGLETLNAESAKCIGKGLHPSKVKDRLHWLNERWKNKVNIGAGFILGLPYDDFKYFDELIRWCSETDVIQHTSFYSLALFKRKPGHHLTEYSSEFSLKPEIYGYTFPNEDDYIYWELQSQKLNYKLCEDIANEFHSIISPKNKVAEFQMISNMNIGIPLDDLYKMTQLDLNRKYDIPSLNNKKLCEYKTLIGLENF
jgi:hypothetical protein